MASSNTGGVQPMEIGSRTVRERERMIGMTDAERAWRARYVKSQTLAPEEPIVPKDYYRERYNPIRRFYRAPMDKFESILAPLTNPVFASVTRRALAKLSVGIAGVYFGWYYFKYNKMVWTRKSGWKVSSARPVVYPGTKDYPKADVRSKGNQYMVLDFDKSRI